MVQVMGGPTGGSVTGTVTPVGGSGGGSVTPGASTHLHHKEFNRIRLIQHNINKCLGE